jgi:hypothetical protein
MIVRSIASAIPTHGLATTEKSSPSPMWGSTTTEVTR